MAIENKDVIRVETDSSASGEATIKEKQLAIIKDTINIEPNHKIAVKHSGYYSASAGDRSKFFATFPAEGSTTEFRDLTISNLAGTGTRKAGLDANGKVVDLGDEQTDYIDFIPQSPAPTYLEGRLWYDEFAQTMVAHTDTGLPIQMGRFVSSRFTAEEDILKGQVLYASNLVSPGVYGVKLAKSDTYNENWVFGVAANDAITGEICEFMQQGFITGVDTTALDLSVPLYMDIIRGALTNSRPEFPAQPIIIGAVLVKDAVNGVLGINMSRDNYQFEFDGCIIEKQQTNIIVDGTSVYMDVSNLADPSRNLPIQLEANIYELETTVSGTGTGVNGASRIELIQGTVDMPQSQTVYIDLTNDLPVLKTTTGYPPKPFASVANVSIRDYVSVTTDGADVHRRITSARAHDGRGRISYLTERWGVESPKWWKGVTPTATVTNDIMTLDVIAGEIYQTHLHQFPALSIDTSGIYVANGTTSGLPSYTKLTNLTDALGYTNIEGDIRDTSATGNIVIFGVVNKDTSECKLFVNLPVRLKNTGGGDGRKMYYDEDGTSVFVVPEELRLTAFLVARIPWRVEGLANVQFLDPDGNGTDSGEFIINLLGNPIGISGGASGGGSFTPNLAQTLAVGNIAGNQIKSLTDGTDPQDAVTKAQLDTKIEKVNGVGTGTTNLEKLEVEPNGILVGPATGADVDNVNITGSSVIVANTSPVGGGENGYVKLEDDAIEIHKGSNGGVPFSSTATLSVSWNADAIIAPLTTIAAIDASEATTLTTKEWVNQSKTGRINRYDTRNDNDTPAELYAKYGLGYVNELKLKSVLSIPISGSSLCMVDSNIPWGDSSIPITQTAHAQNGDYIRYATADTTWSDWKLQVNSEYKKPVITHDLTGQSFAVGVHSITIPDASFAVNDVVVASLNATMAPWSNDRFDIMNTFVSSTGQCVLTVNVINNPISTLPSGSALLLKIV